MAPLPLIKNVVKHLCSSKKSSVKLLLEKGTFDPRGFPLWLQDISHGVKIIHCCAYAPFLQVCFTFSILIKLIMYSQI
eukprot:snap_masked-scaffold_6-processed-gene-16.33-mRNA-1 protein AED:1.00 eAED:1.00 QI:0/0/0/0/1/1/2/0/77